MRRVILDTDILSEIIKKKDPIVLAKAATYAAEHGRFSLTCVTEHEILFGLQSKGDLKKLTTVKGILAKTKSSSRPRRITFKRLKSEGRLGRREDRSPSTTR